MEKVITPLEMVKNSKMSSEESSLKVYSTQNKTQNYESTHKLT